MQPIAEGSRLCLIAGLEHGIRPPLDTSERLWRVSGSALDPWLTLLAALRLDAHALLGPALALDFLDDQWTQPELPTGELPQLYGLELRPLRIWRPLLDHLHEQLGAGRLVVLEPDAWGLPDTDGQEYRRQHRRSTVIVNDLDAANRRLGYFHRDGYFHLQDEDFDALLHPCGPAAVLPPPAAVIELRGLVRRPADTLRHLARQGLERQLERVPTRHPVRRWARRCQRELDWLLHEGGEVHFQAWAEAGLRPLGASAELAAIHLRWLSGEDSGSAHLLQAADALRQLAVLARALHLKGSRAAETGRPLEAGPMVERMARHWSRGMALLGAGEIVLDPPPGPLGRPR